VAGSTFELYRTALRLRREHDLGGGTLDWADGPAEVVAFRNGAVLVLTNFGAEPVRLPAAARVLVSSEPIDDSGRVPTDVTVWALP
jgi:alpha-glucosidase